MKSEFPNNKYLPRVLELFGRGLDDENVTGLHSTSLDAILELSAKGKLPNRGREPKKFYFYPLEGHDFNKILKNASFYSEWITRYRYLREKLHFKPDPEEISNLESLRLDYLPRLNMQCRTSGITEEQIHQWLRDFKNLKSKGVVISISEYADADFDISQVKEFPDERYLRIKGGLGIAHISGIDPRGQYEWDELIKLQKNMN